MCTEMLHTQKLYSTHFRITHLAAIIIIIIIINVIKNGRFNVPQ